MTRKKKEVPEVQDLAEYKQKEHATKIPSMITMDDFGMSKSYENGLNVKRLKPRLNELTEDVGHIAGKFMDQLMEKAKNGSTPLDRKDLQILREVTSIATTLNKSLRDDLRLQIQLEIMNKKPPEFTEAELIEFLEADGSVSEQELLLLSQEKDDIKKGKKS